MQKSGPHHPRAARNSQFPTKTVPEFIADAKANPGKVNMGAAGPRSSTQRYSIMMLLPSIQPNSRSLCKTRRPVGYLPNAA